MRLRKTASGHARRREAIRTLFAGALALAGLKAGAQAPTLDAPNPVLISPLLVTSGQPTAASLRQLASLGFEAVIYLAPPTVRDAVKDEADIVRSQGLAYINIPINFNSPSEADFESFAATLSKFEAKKVLVHCQINMRASSLVFLYRVVVGKESPQLAYEAVLRVWSPDGPWKALLVAILKKHHIQFDPY
jgi:protein tyrosine phosphatase (PTP) superfamily phosphohydrolase (DUF442 family)